MDGFLAGMIIYAAVIFVPFLVYMIVLNHLRQKRLLKHQKEWDEIKKSLPNDDWDTVFDAYNAYIEKLWAERDPDLGACFPRK